MTFTDSEIEELNAAVQEKGSGQSFEKLLDGYRSLVHELKGYNFSIYDYDNDIAGREILDVALQVCRPELRDKALASLRELDERFMAETMEVDREGGTCEGCSFPWIRRLPRDPGPELMRDIESKNY